MPDGKLVALAMSVVLAALTVPVLGQDGGDFPADQIRHGAEIYSRNCAPCHGPRMLDPQAAFDLRTFPRDQKGRFMQSVAKGKNAMPPWGDLFKADDMEALWAYVLAGEK